MNKTECQIIEDCPDFMYGCCQKYLDGEDYHNLLDIIDKTKEIKCT